MIKLFNILNEIINEALPISKAKELYSIQKSDKVVQYQNKIFNELKNIPEYIKSNKTGDRLYFKFIREKDEEEINMFKSNPEIIKILQNNNFKVKDYIKGRIYI
jgi:PDZ domain-containing secreted protein